MQIIEKSRVRDRVRAVKSLINSAGNQIFAVSFIAKGTGLLRKMTCRRHVIKPQYTKAPSSVKRRGNEDKGLITVYDVNCLKYNEQDRLCGRGGWKSLYLSSVTRIKVGGEIYKIVQ